MDKTCVTIDQEFQSLCPSLSEEERKLLEESLATDGCREKIHYWETEDNPIVDGHHRYAICTERNIPYETEAMEFPDRHAAICWILRNQLGRRNLTDKQRSLARGRLYNETKGDPGGVGGSTNGGAKGHNVPSVTMGGATNRAAKIAAQDGVTPRTVKRDGQLAEAADTIGKQAPGLRAAVENGEITAKAAIVLAAAPEATLKALAKLEGPSLRKAVKIAVAKDSPPKPVKPGDQKKHPGLWGEIEALLGRVLNRADALNHEEPNPGLHQKLVAQAKQCAETLKAWRDSAKKNIDALERIEEVNR